MKSENKTSVPHRSNETQQLVLAGLIPLVAFVLQSIFWEEIQPYVWFLFFPAVFFSSWVGGRRGGLLATAISTGLVWYCFIPPRFSWAIERPTAYVSIMVFAGMGILFGHFHECLRKANQQVVAAAARAGEERFRHLFENMNEGVAYCRMIFEDGKPKDFVYLVVNPMFTTLTGLKEVEGKPVSEVIPGLRDSDPDLFAVYGRVAATGQPEKFEKHIKALQMWFVAAVFCPEKGHFAVVFDVVTERKRVEAALRESRTILDAALASMTDAVFISDTAGRFIEFNEAFATFHRFKDKTECAKSLEDYPKILEVFLANGELAPLDMWAVPRALRGETVKIAEYSLRRKDTGESWVGSYSFSPIRDKSGAVVGSVVVGRDITERKRADEALRSSEAQFRAMFELASIGMAQAEPRTGRFVRVNHKMCDITGYSVDELLQKRIPEITHPEDREKDLAAFQRTVRGEAPYYRIEKRYLRKDGTEAWVNVNMTVIRDAGGEPVRTMAAIEDITERKQAELALQLSDFSVNQASLPTFWTARDSRIVRVNHAACAMLGYTEAELLRLSISELDPDFTAARWPAHWQELREQKRLNFETQNRHKDGHLIPVEVSLNWFEFGGQEYNFAFIRDITERQRVEKSHARLATAVEQAAETIVITDIKGDILYANPAFEKTTGYTCAEALGQNPRLLKSGQQDAEFYRRMWELLRRGEVWCGHFINRRKDGSLYEEEATISPIRDSGGDIINYVAVKRDVTREVLLEAQFRQTQKMEAFGQLAGGVAHDFNNILQVIQLQAGLLRHDSTVSPEQKEIALEIVKSSERAAALTRQLLLFSRKQKLELRDLNLSDSIAGIMKMLQRIVGEDVSIQLKLSPRPLLVYADAGMLDQILMNLTVNARDAMPKGGSLIIETSAANFDEVTAAQDAQAKPGMFACVSVTDTGCGIRADVLPRIFEPFFTTKEVGKGTGLGLATVFGIVQQHQGWISAYSEVGQGSTFRVYLPRLTASADDNAVTSPEMASIQGGTETILLVEDESAVRATVQKVLSQLGYRVLEASSGAEALEVWKQHRTEIRLLLTDLIMPGGMNGQELAEQLLRDDPKLQVVYASGYRGDIVGKDFHLQKGSNFISKPFDVPELAETLRHSLNKSA